VRIQMAKKKGSNFKNAGFAKFGDLAAPVLKPEPPDGPRS
jgi:hypothetical protein